MAYFAVSKRMISNRCAQCEAFTISYYILCFDSRNKTFNTWMCCNNCIPDRDRNYERVTLRFFLKLFKNTKNRKVYNTYFTQQWIEKLLLSEISETNHSI